MGRIAAGLLKGGCGVMSREMKVGMFFVAGMLILGVLTFYAGGFEDWMSDRYILTAHFDSVAGLDVEDVVTLSGVEVGKVKELEISNGRVKVVLLLDKGVVVPSGSIARIESESLLGGKYVGLQMGTPGTAPLEDGDELETEEAADLAKMLQGLSDVAQDVRVMVKSFNSNQEDVIGQVGEILAENRDNIRTGFETISRMAVDNEEGVKELVENLREVGPQLVIAMDTVNEIMDTVRSGEGTLGKLVHDESLYNDMKDLSSGLKEASTTLTRILGDNEDDIKVIVVSLKEAVPKLEATMGRIDKIAAKIEAGEGTLGKLIQDETLYDETTRMVKEARHAAEDVRDQVPIMTFTSVLFGAFQ